MKIEKRTIYQITIDGDYDFVDEALAYCVKNAFTVMHVFVREEEKHGVKSRYYKVFAQKEKIWL